MSPFPFFFQILKAFASELSLFNKFNRICTITQPFKKNFFCKNILVATPICEESNVLWYYFKRGETFHKANHWKGNINTDANPVPPRWIYCLQNFELPCLCYFYAVLCSKKKGFFWISTSFANLTNAIAWHLLVKSVLINLEREAVVFQFIISNFFIMMWHTINMSTYLVFESGTFVLYHTAFCHSILLALISLAGIISFLFLGIKFCCNWVNCFPGLSKLGF